MKKLFLYTAILITIAQEAFAQSSYPVTAPLFTPPPGVSDASLSSPPLETPIAPPAQAPVVAAPPAQITPAVPVENPIASPPPLPTSAYVPQLPPVRVDIVGRQMFFDSVDAGDLDRMDQLVKKDPSLLYPDVRDTEGNTPLIRASMHDQLNAVKYLVSRGAELNAVNNESQTALMVSYNAGHYDTAVYLLSKGAADPYGLATRIKSSELMGIHGKGLFTTTEVEIGAGVLATAAVAGGVAAAGGGGGSSSPSSGSTGNINPENLNPAIYETSIAANQQGFLDMNTQYALALGYNGSIYNRNSNGTLVSDTPIGNVKVAVVDTGVDLTHPALESNILTSDSVSCTAVGGCSAGGSDTSTDGHGTGVASIIAANLTNGELYGIASSSNIMSIAFADGSGNLITGADVLGIQYALAHGAQVFNGSYGFPTTIPENASVATVQSIVSTVYNGTTAMAQYQAGVAQHAIFVYAAGNDGNTYTSPDLPASLPYYFQGATAPAGITQANYNTINPSHYNWSNNWVAVVSVNSSNTISSFSNECGVAMNWCLAAPGENITIASKTGGYATGNGTSFAAPNVTGAIAVMLGAWPQLSPETVLQILFNTATDLGAPGVDPVYGHGLINLQKATSPTLGGWSLTTGAFGTTFGFTTSGFGLSAPFGNALTLSPLSLQFIDGYGKNYTIPLSVVGNSLAQSKTDLDRLTSFAGGDFETVVNLGGNNKLGYSSSGNTLQTAYANANNPYGKFSYQSEVPIGQNDTALVTVNYQTDLVDSLNGIDQRRLLVSDALRNPYLNIIDQTNSGVVSYATGQSKFTAAAYYGNFGDEYNYRFDNNNLGISGAHFEYAYYGDDANSNITLSNGIMSEQNSFLGAETSGAFGISKAVTTYAGISGKYELADGVALIGNYSAGITKVSASQTSMFTNFNDITTNAFAAGAEFDDVGSKNDRLTFMVSQPLRVTSGNANMLLPVNVTSTDQILYNQGNLNLTPTDREMDFESSYNVKLAPDSLLSFSAIFRKDPDNTSANGNDAVLFGKFQYGF